MNDFEKEIIERLTRIETEAQGAHEQTKKTNGRVTHLETKVGKHDKFILGLTVGIAVLLVVKYPDLLSVLHLII